LSFSDGAEGIVPFMADDDLKDALRQAIADAGTDATALSRAIGHGPDYVRDYLSGRKASLSADAWEAIRGEIGFTRPLVVPARKPPAKSTSMRVKPIPRFLGARDLPVYAAVEGGSGEMVIDSTEPVEIVPRPWYLKNVTAGYAVVVIGHSMEPRYEAGEIVVVNPKAALVRGKDAIITTATEGGDFRAMVKTYLGSTASAWRLRQYNPPSGEPADFEKSKKEWPFAFRVVGRYDGG